MRTYEVTFCHITVPRLSHKLLGLARCRWDTNATYDRLQNIFLHKRVDDKAVRRGVTRSLQDFQEQTERSP